MAQGAGGGRLGDPVAVAAVGPDTGSLEAVVADTLRDVGVSDPRDRLDGILDWALAERVLSEDADPGDYLRFALDSYDVVLRADEGVRVAVYDREN